MDEQCIAVLHAQALKSFDQFFKRQHVVLQINIYPKDMTFSYVSRSLPKFSFQSAFCSAVLRAASPIFLNDLRFLIAKRIFSARSSTSLSRNSQPFTSSSIHSWLPGISETRQGNPLASASINVTEE